LGEILGRFCLKSSKKRRFFRAKTFNGLYYSFKEMIIWVRKPRDNHDSFNAVIKSSTTRKCRFTFDFVPTLQDSLI
jgi:hypothetical protein